VNRPRDELLARTRLTQNEDGSVSAGHPRHLSEHVPKRREEPTISSNIEE